ncbi:DUF6801 domain-containing protein [Saccharomonospora halophila]|uniref:DUF6801 domain-containing protein n=1 Tax=Saccharomonospora halophila TaxID=129922 RepID=UPI000368959B|nr:DUF6801 domain-containing protein [Saccharomonospora halophila]
MTLNWRSARRRSAPIALLGAALVAVAVGAPAASGGDDTGRGAADGTAHETAELRYRCETDSAQREIRVRVGLSLPESAEVSTPVGAAGMTVEMALPEPVVGALADGGASEVLGRAMLDVAVAGAGDPTGSEPRIVPSAELRIPVTPLPRGAPLTLTATGEAPEITPTAAGEMVLSADRLNLLLTAPPQGADPGSGDGDGGDGDTGGPGDGSSGDGSPGDVSPGDGTGDAGPTPQPGTGSGTEDVDGAGGGAAPAATDDPDGGVPAIPAFDCVPAPDQETRIGTLTVAGDGTVTPGDPGDPDPDGERGAQRDGPARTRAATQEVPEDCEVLPEPGTPWCASLGGYTNIAKLDSAARIDPGIINLSVPNPLPCGDGSEWYWWCQTTQAELRHQGENGLPPTRNSFHAFDFMPSSATVELSQVGEMVIDVRFQITGSFDGSVVAVGAMSARLDDVTVNGTPLDVGPDCRTEEPFPVELTADYPDNYAVDAGGTLDGYVEIPAFSGCGVGEDLDPLMTGLISGPGNYVKMTQGRICEITRGNGCPPAVPELER